MTQKFNYKTSEQLDYVISEGDKQLVDERRKTAKTSDYITRNQSNEKIKKKYGF